jgi:hypothetical protein
MSEQFDTAASAVQRVLSEAPGLRGTGSGKPGTTGDDLITDLVAVRLYLTGPARHLDDAVRSGTVGPHVPFGRCVTAGLRRLPSFRGAARLCATLTEAEWQWYASQRLVTEWAFCPAVANDRLRLPGTVEFWIWSTTARQASLLEPRVPGQVLFLPGTSFKVLRVRGEGVRGEGVRGEGHPQGQRVVLLREVTPAEIGPDGTFRADRARQGRVPFDELALTGLQKAVADSAASGPAEELPPGYANRFASPPGLLVKPADTGLAAASTLTSAAVA